MKTMQHRFLKLACLLFAFVCLDSFVQTSQAQSRQTENKEKLNSKQDAEQQGNSTVTPSQMETLSQMETITLGAGCFWCVEAVFMELDGVKSVKPGYCNGSVINPTYEQVCSGLTGHAEVCQIVYDASKLDFGEILQVFWRTHDPTTLNRQGADKGSQYRSGIYFHTEEQGQIAEGFKKKLADVGAFKDKIVTEIKAIDNFSFAEDYHRNYFKNNPNTGYCRAIIQPKMEKFRSAFADLLKKK